MPVYIVDHKQELIVISSDKKVCVRCSVLGLCSLLRRVDELTTPAWAQLVWLQYSSHTSLYAMNAALLTTLTIMDMA